MEVSNEISNGIRRDGLWAKAITNSNGSEEKAKSLYIKYRIQSIKDEIKLAEAFAEETEDNSENINNKEQKYQPEEKNIVKELFILIITISVIMLIFIILSLR